jgi:transposase
MAEVKLRGDQWRKIRSFLAEHPKVYVGQERQCRRFIEGVLWMTRSGAQWRLLPKRYGNWNSVYKRFDRWSERGLWKEMVEYFADDPDMEKLMLDSSVIRAHACAAGAGHKRGVRRHKPLAIAEAASAPNFT